MKRILTISGSNREASSNLELLRYINDSHQEYRIEYFDISRLPAFDSEMKHSNDVELINFKSVLRASDACIICTPEYIHNIPSVLKSALEWTTESGEFYQKKVLALTFTPHEPRGEKAMQSLLWSLTALEANVITKLNLFHTDFNNKDGKLIFEGDGVDLLKEAMDLL